MQVILNTTTDRQQTVPGQGNYLYIESATGPVRITVTMMDGRKASFPMRSRSQMRFDQDIDELDIVNDYAGVNTVVLFTGLGEFLPNNDGQKVTLTGQDLAIEIQTPPGQPIGVECADLGATNDTAATSDGGNFSLIALVKRLLGKVPNNGQKVMSGSLPVVIASDQSAVAVSGPLTNAELLAATVDVQQVVYSTNTPGNKITGDGTIAAKATRKYLIVKPLRTNTGIGWLSTNPNEGVALEGGDAALILETTAAVNIKATNPADVFTFTEIEA